MMTQKTDATIHLMTLEHWNRQKIISGIQQRFSCLLVEGIAKKCKNEIFHSVFISNPLYPFWNEYGQAG